MHSRTLHSATSAVVNLLIVMLSRTVARRSRGPRPETRCWLEQDSWSGNTLHFVSNIVVTNILPLSSTLLPSPVRHFLSSSKKDVIVYFYSSVVPSLHCAIYLLTLEEDSSQSAGCFEAAIIGNPPSHLILYAMRTPSYI